MVNWFEGESRREIEAADCDVWWPFKTITWIEDHRMAEDYYELT